MRAIEKIQTEGRAPAAAEKPKKKRARGRPRVDVEANVQTFFRTTKGEHDAYAREAKRKKLPLRTWIRMLLNEGVEELRAGRRGSSLSKIGAQVGYCGHDASFVADVFEVGGAVVIVANGTIEKQLRRPAGEVTHWVRDFPSPGYWGRERGIFVVPREQVDLVVEREAA